MSFLNKVLFSCFTGLLLYWSWAPTNYFTFISFVAFIPLLFVLDNCKKNNKIFFLFQFISFSVWNFTTIWWIYYSSSIGAFATFLLNAFFMSIPWFLSFIVYKKNEKLGLLSIIFFYLSFEYLHFNWDISYPWLTLGNLFSSSTKIIQWYEYTGVAGGSLWVLVINILLFYGIKKYINKFKITKHIIIILILFTLPIVISYKLYNNEKHNIEGIKNNNKNVVLVQPNYDAYKEKFIIDEDIQIKHFLNLAEKKIDSNTIAIIFPETALINTFWEHNYMNISSIMHLLDWQINHKNISIISGAITTSQVDSNFNSPAKREFLYLGVSKIYYESYNTCFILKPDSSIKFYHKSKLVPGTEKMPFQKYLSFLGNFIIDLGGTNGAYGIQDTVTNFILDKQNILLAPIICYESIYGDYVAKFVNKGASIITLVTNDDWWGTSNGYIQHALYGQLRAIENRRYIYRSANTGISMLINSLGEREQIIDWQKADALKCNINIETKKTFYTKHQDWLYKLSLVLAMFICFIYFLNIKIYGKRTNK